jgi:hypothetical protein
MLGLCFLHARDYKFALTELRKADAYSRLGGNRFFDGVFLPAHAAAAALIIQDNNSEKRRIRKRCEAQARIGKSPFYDSLIHALDAVVARLQREKGQVCPFESARQSAAGRTCQHLSPGRLDEEDTSFLALKEVQNSSNQRSRNYERVGQPFLPVLDWHHPSVDYTPTVLSYSSPTSHNNSGLEVEFPLTRSGHSNVETSFGLGLTACDLALHLSMKSVGETPTQVHLHAGIVGNRVRRTNPSNESRVIWAFPLP